MAENNAVPNYLVQSILCTICCCLPFGIVAIVYAAQVNSKIAGGDMAGAEASSKNAKMWCWVAFGCGIAAWVITALIDGAAIMAAVGQAHH